MTEKVEYEVLATLKASGSLGKQMKMLMGSTSAVQKGIDRIQSSMMGAGKAIMGSTAQTAAGWAKTGGTMAVAAGGAGLGGLLHQGLAFNESMETSKNTIGAMYQLYGQNQSDILKNLTQAELVQKNLFDLAKRAPGEYEDAVNVYKGAAKGLTVANESIADQMKFMESAIMLPQVVGGGLNSDVVGGQLGRIIMGGAGAEFETWKVLAPAILKAGQEMKGLNGQAQLFKDSMRPNADLTMAWNALAQDNPKVAMEVLKRAVMPLKELAPVFENAWEGVLGTTMSNMKMISGAFTKPFFEMRKAFLIRMNKSGIFSDQSIGKLQHIAAVMGILFATGAGRVFSAAEKAVAYIRDNWKDITQNVHDAFVIGQSLIKGAFTFGLFRMMAGAAVIAASFAMKGVQVGRKVVSTGYEKANQLAYMRAMSKSGLDPSKRPRDEKGQFLSFQKAFALIQKKRSDAVGEKYGKGPLGGVLAPVMQFFTKIGPLALILGAGIPLVVMAVAAFGALFTIVGGIAAYVITNWQSISSEIVTGLRNGTITLAPLLIAVYTFWERLKLVGEVFLGSGGHAAQFSRVLDLMTGAVAFAANGISFFMRAIAYSMGIWGMLKLAFQGVLRAVLGIIEAASYLPGGPDDDTVARAQAKYQKYSDGVTDTFTDIDKLLQKADDIDAFVFKQVDIERINKEAEEMAAKVAQTLEDMGKEDPKNQKGPKGPKVQINHLTINQDLRDTDPDRLMAAFIKPLERMADQRVQAYDMTEQGA